MRFLKILIAAMLSFHIGCTSNLENAVSEMMDKEFKCDTTALDCVKNHYTRMLKSNAKFSLIVYYDSHECMACHSNRLNSWNKFIEMCDGHRVEVIFIFSPKKSDIQNLKMNLERQRFKYPVYVDTCGVIIKDNPWIPNNSLCHTFLINSSQKVIFIGDPRRNKTLMNLFLSLVK